MTGATPGEAEFRVAVIDDAFDTIAASTLDPVKLGQFVDAVEQDETLSEERDEANLPLQSVSDVTDDTLSAILSSPSATPGIEAVLRRVFNTELAEREEVFQLVRDLEAAGAKVEQHSAAQTRSAPKSLQDVDIVFLDFYLGQPSDPAARELSVEAAKRIVAEGKTAGRIPLIVLMSSRLKGTTLRRDERVDAFKGESGVPGPAFLFAAKSELVGRWQAEMYCNAARRTSSVRLALEELAGELGGALLEAGAAVKRAVEELELGDYAYLQRLRLEADGHPFGDYLAWLIGARFSAIAFEELLRERIRAVNRVRFDDMMPSHMPPSERVAQMYEAALFEQNLGPLGPHPRDQQGDGAEASMLPFLLLGDVFESQSSGKVVMIASADCDLASAPDAKSRQLAANRSVMLIKGNLQPVGEGTWATLRTDLYTLEKVQYAVEWELSEWTSVPLGGLRDWLSKEGYDTTSYRRFRPLFALEIQQAQHNHQSRIGVPKSPPLFRPLRGRALWSSPTGVKDLFQIADAEFVVTRGISGKAEQIHLNASVAAKLYEEIEARVDADLASTSSLNDESLERKALASIKQRNQKREKWIEIVNGVSGTPWKEVGSIMENIAGLPLSVIHCGSELAMPDERKLKGLVLLLQSAVTNESGENAGSNKSPSELAEPDVGQAISPTKE